MLMRKTLRSAVQNAVIKIQTDTPRFGKTNTFKELLYLQLHISFNVNSVLSFFTNRILFLGGMIHDLACCSLIRCHDSDLRS